MFSVEDGVLNNENSIRGYLGAFGAEIIKVESIQRPDGFRYSGAWAHEGDRWYERSAMWQAHQPQQARHHTGSHLRCGRDLARRLVRDADVVVENFSPRVIEQFGLDYESLVELKPDVILVRMPGFGLQGPWRDYVGWALNFEQTSGMAAVTGYADGRRAPCRGPPTRSSGCTPASRCSPRSSIGAAPAKANSSRSRRSRSRRASPPSR